MGGLTQLKFFRCFIFFFSLLASTTAGRVGALGAEAKARRGYSQFAAQRAASWADTPIVPRNTAASCSGRVEKADPLRRKLRSACALYVQAARGQMCAVSCAIVRRVGTRGWLR